MEETLQLILKQLNTLSSDFASLKEGQDSLKSDVASLKEGQDSLKSDVASLKEGQAGLKLEVKEIKIEVKEINKKTDIIFNQTTGLTEFTTSAAGSLQRIEEELNTVEMVTYKNSLDITRLKAIK